MSRFVASLGVKITCSKKFEFILAKVYNSINYEKYRCEQKSLHKFQIFTKTITQEASALTLQGRFAVVSWPKNQENCNTLVETGSCKSFSTAVNTYVEDLPSRAREKKQDNRCSSLVRVGDYNKHNKTPIKRGKRGKKRKADLGRRAFSSAMC